MEEASLSATPDIEEEQNERSPLRHDWFNFSLTDCDFQVNDFCGFDFSEEFMQQDQGQLQLKPCMLEMDNLILVLRTKDRDQH